MRPTEAWRRRTPQSGDRDIMNILVFTDKHS